VATPFAHGRDASVSHGELGFHHLRHQGIETDASVAKALRRDHHSVSLPSVRQFNEGCRPETVIPRTSSGRKSRKGAKIPSRYLRAMAQERDGLCDVLRFLGDLCGESAMCSWRR
jgi:hypothetical protein